MYLVGDFDRFFDDELENVKVLKSITREHLAKARGERTYNVINLETLEYFQPELNQWAKFKSGI